MNKLLLFTVLLFSLQAYAAKKIEGTIVFSDFKILKAILLIPVFAMSEDLDFTMIQQRFHYLDKRGERQEVTAKQAKQVTFYFEGKLIKMISRRYNDGNTFLQLIIDGPVKLFKGYYMEYRLPHTYTMVSDPLLQKGDESIFGLIGVTFRDQMREYFKDCPALVDLIQSREFKRNDMEDIVKYYNEKCVTP